MQPDPAPARLIVDANVFFKRTLKQIADSTTSPDLGIPLCTTTPAVIGELKDQKTKLYFDTQLPFQVIRRSPTDKAVNRVTSFAKKTGDYISLSSTDIGLIALAVDCIVETGNASLLKKEPQKLKEAKPVSFKKHYHEFEDSDSQEEEQEDEGWNYVVGKSSEKKEEPKEEKQQETAPDIREKHEEEGPKEEQKEEKELQEDQETEGKGEEEQQQVGEQDDDSCEDEWITAQNIAEMLEQEKSATEASSGVSGVILVTGDFAMQNVALQLGVPVISSQTGLRIRTLRTYCLLCKSCAKVQPDNSRQFCCECGNHNLRKASLYVHENGAVTYFVNPLRGYSKRGTVFSLPKPKGGRKNQDIVLCEDELLYGVRARLREELKKQHEKESKKQMDMDGYLAGQAVQFVSRIKGAARRVESNIRLEYGTGVKNPNSQTRPRYAKKKKQRNH